MAPRFCVVNRLLERSNALERATFIDEPMAQLRRVILSDDNIDVHGIRGWLGLCEFVLDVDGLLTMLSVKRRQLERKEREFELKMLLLFLNRTKIYKQKVSLKPDQPYHGPGGGAA